MRSETLASSRLFPKTDYLVVRQAIARLPASQMKVVVLRFWSNYSLIEIARLMRLSYDAVERLLSQALIQLRILCLSDPSFSRTITEAIPCEAQAYACNH